MGGKIIDLVRYPLPARLIMFSVIATIGWVVSDLPQSPRYYRRGLSEHEWLGAMRSSSSFLRDPSWLVMMGIRAAGLFFAVRLALPEIFGW